jgi:hypothetical protein
LRRSRSYRPRRQRPWWWRSSAKRQPEGLTAGWAEEHLRCPSPRTHGRPVRLCAHSRRRVTRAAPMAVTGRPVGVRRLALETDRLMADGLTRDEARHAAARAFGIRRLHRSASTSRGEVSGSMSRDRVCGTQGPWRAGRARRLVHSSWSASIGSTLTARRAGSQTARHAVNTSARETVGEVQRPAAASPQRRAK